MQPDPSSRDIVDLYERNADAWVEDRGTSLIERDWLDRFTAALPPSGTILDIGCATGDPIARHLVDQGFAVTGLDSSPSLLAIARARLPAAEWIVGDMRAMDLGRRFDGLLAWHSVFHLAHDDQRAMFPRYAAHAKPGAMLMFTSGDGHGEKIGSWRGAPLYHASLDPDEYRQLLDANGFDTLESAVRDGQAGNATIWLARARARAR